MDLKPNIEISGSELVKNQGDQSKLAWYLIILTGFIFVVVTAFIPHLLKPEYQVGEIAKKKYCSQ